jgi:hypothetical protein
MTCIPPVGTFLGFVFLHPPLCSRVTSISEVMEQDHRRLAGDTEANPPGGRDGLGVRPPGNGWRTGERLAEHVAIPGFAAEHLRAGGPTVVGASDPRRISWQLKRGLTNQPVNLCA